MKEYGIWLVGDGIPVIIVDKDHPNWLVIVNGTYGRINGNNIREVSKEEYDNLKYQIQMENL